MKTCYLKLNKEFNAFYVKPEDGHNDVMPSIRISVSYIRNFVFLKSMWTSWNVCFPYSEPLERCDTAAAAFYAFFELYADKYGFDTLIVLNQGESQIFRVYKDEKGVPHGEQI